MLLPTGTAMLFRAYPPERRARITRLLIVPIILAPASAPIIGGVFTQDLSWRWVFLVNVPVGILVFAFCAVNLSEHREHARGRFDLIGFALGGGGLALALYALSEGAILGWGSAPILATAGGPVDARPVRTLGVPPRGPDPQPPPAERSAVSRHQHRQHAQQRRAARHPLPDADLPPGGRATRRSARARRPSRGPRRDRRSQSVGRFYPRLGPRTMAAGGALLVCALVLCFQWVDAARASGCCAPRCS